MIKGVLKKILICILISIIMFNFGITSVTFAAPVTPERIDDFAETPEVPEDEEDEESDGAGSGTSVAEIEEQQNNRLDGVLDGIAGILTWFYRAYAWTISSVLNLETYAIAVSAGKNDSDALSLFITPFDIIFNRFILTDINIFNTDGLDPDGMVATIRTSIAMWHSIASAFAIGILIVVLIILVAKLALIDDVAERKAKIKIALKDWFLSVVLVLLMRYIVILIVNVNNGFVGAIKGVAALDISEAVTAIQVEAIAIDNGALLGWGALIAYVLLSVQTLIFLCKYIFRFFTVSLLIIIAPLVPVPYAVSKMNDQKTSTALNTWLYEFINAVFSQIIHCIVYTCLVGVAFQGFAANTEIKGIEALAPATFAIFAMFFIGPAERLIRTIFKLKKGGGAMQVVKELANGTRNAVAVVNGVNSAATNIANASTTIAGAFGVDLNNRAGENSGGAQVLSQGMNNIRYAGGLEGSLPRNGLNGLNGVNGEGADLLMGLPAGSGDGSGIDGGAMVNTLLAAGQNGEGGVAVGIATQNKDKDEEVTNSIKALEAAVLAGSNTDGDPSDDAEGETPTIVAEGVQTNEISSEQKDELTLESFFSEEKKEELDPAVIDELTKILERLKDEAVDEIVAKSQFEQLINAGLTDILANIKTEIAGMLAGISLTDEDELKKALEEIYTKYGADPEIVKQSLGDDVDAEKFAGEQYKGLFAEYAQTQIDEILEKARKESQGDTDLPKVEIPSETSQLIQTAIAEAITNPGLQEIAKDIAIKQGIIEGKVEGEIDTSDEVISQIIFDITRKHAGISSDNHEKALKEARALVKKEGDASLEEFEINPSMDSYKSLSKAGQTVVELENILKAQDLTMKAVRNFSGASSMATQIAEEYVPSQRTSDVINQIKPKQE